MFTRAFAVCLVLACGAPAEQDPPAIRASSPDQKHYVVAEGSKVSLFDGATQKIIWQFRTAQGMVTALAFSPDGKRLAVGSDDSQLRLIDAPTGKELIRLKSDGSATRISFSLDGKILIVKQNNQKEHKWELATGKLIE